MSLDVYLESDKKTPSIVFHANITHNLNTMAEEAGIYKYLWTPDLFAVSTASRLITPLRSGLQLLKDNPEYFKAFNPENGWGNYEDFISFVEKYLAACEQHPEATVFTWR